MTRVSGLPEPRHKSQLCFSESHLWFLVKKKITEALMFETNAKSSILGRKKKSHLVPERHIDLVLRLYLVNWQVVGQVERIG